MDTTKLRLLAAVAGILLGLGGVAALVVALTLAIALFTGLILAAFIVSGTLLATMFACLAFCLQPFRTVRDEVEDLEETTAGALADLPFDTMRAIVRKRPVTSTAMAALMGYSIVRHPQMAQRQAERFLMGLI